MSKNYFVIFTPRSGSFLLCECLRNTGLAGLPDEYLATPKVTQFVNQNAHIENSSDYVQYVMNKFYTQNGVFGLKTTYTQLLYWVNQAHKTDIQTNNSVHIFAQKHFGELNYIYLSRHDKVRQAISYYRALKTGLWTWKKGKFKRRLPEFNFEEIHSLVGRIRHDEARIQKYFSENNITPLNVLYERFILEYEKTALRILEFLDVDVPHPLTFTEPKLRQMADEVTDQWVILYNNLANTNTEGKQHP